MRAATIVQRLSLAVTTAVMVVLGLNSGWASALPPAPSLAGAEAHIALLGQAGGRVQAVAARGDVAYVGVGAQLVVLDVADPNAPRETARTGVLSAPVADVDIDGDRAYVAHGTSLLVLDLADPHQPRQIAVVYVPALDDVRRLVVDGGFAYVLLESLHPSGLAVIDVRDPHQPSHYDLYPDVIVGTSNDIDVRGGYAYVVGYDGLLVLDVSDPSAVRATGRLEIGQARGVAVAGDTVYVSTNEALHVVDVSDRARPESVGSIATGVGRLAVRAGYLYGAAGDDGLRVFEVSDPHHPGAVWLGDLGGATHDLAVVDARVYVTRPESGLTVLYGGTPPVGEQRDVFQTWTGARDLTVRGPIAHVAASAGLVTVDLTDPTAPSTLSTLAIPEDARRIVVDGAVAFVSTVDRAVVTVDVTATSAPRRLATVGVADPEPLIAASDGVLAVAELQRLRLIDARDPSAPRDTKSLPWDGADVSGMLLDGGVLYVVDRVAGLRVFDVRGPANPSEVGRLAYRSEFYGRGMALDGDTLYVVHAPWPEPWAGPRHLDVPQGPPPPPEENRVIAIDVNDPAEPRLVRDLGQTGWPRGLAIADGHLYVASGFAPYYSKAVIAHGLDGGAAYAWRALPDVPDAVGASGDLVSIALGELGLVVGQRRSGAAPTLTPAPTRQPPPTATPDPSATPSPTPPFGTATPRPTSTPPDAGTHACHLPWSGA